MEMMMLIVAWGNQEEHTVSIVQTMPLACADFDTVEMHRRIPHKGYGETVACVIPEVPCVNQAPY